MNLTKCGWSQDYGKKLVILPTDLVLLQDNQNAKSMLTFVLVLVLVTNQSASKRFPGIQQTGGIGQ